VVVRPWPDFTQEGVFASTCLEGYSGRARAGSWSSANSPETEYHGDSISSIADAREFVAASPGVQLLAGTAWLFSRQDLDGTLDTLVIDQAGQVALADARNVILLGDPLQLAQVSQGTHPEGTGVSALEHLLGDHPTVPPDMGIFLDRTRPMHPDVCQFVSEIVYEGRLDGLPEVARQATSYGTGLRYLPVDHVGNVAAAPEEAERVAREILAMRSGSWTNRDGVTQPLGESDFMVVAPYNAQVRLLRRALEAAGLGGVPVGPSTSSRGARRRWSSTRWRPPAPRTCRAAWSSSSPATASTSPSPGPGAWPASSPARACWSREHARSSRCG
jgi:uncharacterized protein